MLEIALKHFIYELCIDVLFCKVTSNFSDCKSDVDLYAEWVMANFQRTMAYLNDIQKHQDGFID